jgi:hypothetical protein
VRRTMLQKQLPLLIADDKETITKAIRFILTADSHMNHERLFVNDGA